MYNYKDIYKKFNIIDKILASNEVSPQLFELLEIEECKDYFFTHSDSMIWFKELKAKGYFSPDKNPPPELDKKNNGYKIPEWTILIYLEKLTKIYRDLDDEILQIILDTSLFIDSNGNHIDNYRTWWGFVKILCNIPLEKVPVSIFQDAIPVWFISIFTLTLPGSDLVTDLLPIYLNQINSDEDIQKVESLVNLLLSVKNLESKKSVLGKTVEIHTKVESHWLEEGFITKNYTSLIARKCTNKVIFALANTIKKVFNLKYKDQDYSSVWLTDLTIEQPKIIGSDEYLLAVILRNLVLERVKINEIAGNEIISEFLSDKFPHYLFKRIALVSISSSWKQYNKFFDKILDCKTNNYFEIDSFKPELTHLLLTNSHLLTKNRINIISQIIEKGPIKELPSARKEKYILYWKQKWYRVLDKIPHFKKLYQKIERITKQKIELEKLNEPIVFHEEFDKSPLGPEEIVEKSNPDIIKYISEYKPSGEFSNSSSEGLYHAFQSAVELLPEKFSSELDLFIIPNYHLLSSLYNGFEEAWKKGKDLDWDSILNFTLKLLNIEWFWRAIDAKNRINNYFDWTISAIADLVQEGCRRDGRAFSEEFNTIVEKIIVTTLDKFQYREGTYHGERVTHAMNSSSGKTITALIFLSLREARLADKSSIKMTHAWSKSLKNAYDRCFEKNIFEAYTLLGQYLPNLRYVDKKWTESKAKNIHLLKDEKYFESFMEGYLFSSNIYDSLYMILKPSYERALSIRFEEARIRERLVQHIAVGYLRGNEELDDNSLLGKLFGMNKPEYIREIVEFLWHQRDYILSETSDNAQEEKEKDEFKLRIISLWDYIIKIYGSKAVLVEQEKKVLSELAKFAIYSPELNKQVFKRLMYSAKYVTIDFDSPYFIEYLNDIKNKNDSIVTSQYIARLFLEMLSGSADPIPDYKWENIVEILEYLYEKGKKNPEIKDLANKICIFYAKHRNLNLRAMYEENNSQLL